MFLIALAITFILKIKFPKNISINQFLKFNVTVIKLVKVKHLWNMSYCDNIAPILGQHCPNIGTILWIYPTIRGFRQLVYNEFLFYSYFSTIRIFNYSYFDYSYFRLFVFSTIRIFDYSYFREFVFSSITYIHLIRYTCRVNTQLPHGPKCRISKLL